MKTPHTEKPYLVGFDDNARFVAEVPLNDSLAPHDRLMLERAAGDQTINHQVIAWH